MTHSASAAGFGNGIPEKGGGSHHQRVIAIPRHLPIFTRHELAEFS